MADSALSILRSDQPNGSDQVKLLRIIAANSTSPEEKIKFAKRLIEKAEEFNDLEQVFVGYHFLGYGYMRSGRILAAIENYYRLMAIADSLGNDLLAGDARLNLANTHKISKEYEQAKKIELEALNYYEKIRNINRLVSVYLNLGNTYYYLENYDSSLISLQKAKVMDDSLYLDAYIDGTAALALAKTKRIDSAYSLLGAALEKLEESQDHYAIADCKVQFGTILLESQRIDEAVEYLNSGYEIARQHGLKEQIQDGALMLSKLYEKQENYLTALKYQREYYIYRDSIVNAESIRRIGDERTAYEVGLKQAELDVANAQKQTQQYFILAIAAFAILILIVAVIVYRNFLDKKRVNLQLEVQKRILEDQKQSLEELNNTKDRFFSIISHDLRGPVQAFHGVSRIIKFLVKQKQTEQLEELAEHIDESADRLSALLDNLLSWAVQQQGQITYIPEKLDMSEICNDLAMTFKNMADGKGIEIHHVAPKDIYSWSDRNTTMTIFRNILNNALKFTPEGGEVFFEVKSEGSNVVTVIRDTGVGIPKDKIPDLFKMKAKKSTWGTDNEKGLGLGLQLVKEFVDMNKGDISVSSEEGKGTSFTISLPAYQEEVLAAKK